jgi:23S rRNA G2445 N2-methylase RlmL
MPGLETLAFSEVRGLAEETGPAKFARGIALFEANIAPEALLQLRTTEDVFVTLAHIRSLGPGPDSLRVLHSATLRADITEALRLWRRAHGGSQPKSWRVVSQMHGPHQFRRMDAGQAVKDAIRKMMPRKIQPVNDDADVEIWLALLGSQALVGMRLSDASMRHRTYKREHLPASLRPTIAAAMSFLAQPTAQDIVLDPLCGAGTILIERALLAPYERLAGGDVRPEAVAMAKRNAHSAHVSAKLQPWDARELPLDAASMTRLITNLPFGKQIGERGSLDQLYTALCKEFTRVLTPDGVMVTLTSEDRLWQSVLQKRGWRIKKKQGLVLLGQSASIFAATRS